ncbi:MAG: sigma-70 family RNA polymerase sigma factor, partial [Gemmataceae bacterium]|nr:sigma-70 family RNA polymerase sigma factor [Gemmataceae bacterium]
AAARDQAAFAELVRRHGPVVLAVCRRVAGQDADDAFQAAFLVLARRAGSVSRPELLGNWLYGVAVRVAQKARRTAARRRAREVQVTAMPDPPTFAESAADIGPVLHEELDKLPGYYREAVVLCDLRGVPRAEAAKLLGVPEGTVSSRLAAGRKKLADRLARRGVALSVAAVPVVLAEGRAAVPDSLLRQTCGAVADWAAGGAVPPPVHRLAEGGLTVRKVLLIGAFAAAAVVGVSLAARPGDTPAPPDRPILTAEKGSDPTPAAGPDAEPKPDDMPTPFAGPRLRKAIDLPVGQVDEVAWTADGKSLAVREGRRTNKASEERNTVLFVPDVTADPQSYHWIDLPPDGRLVGFTPYKEGLFVRHRELVTAVREYRLVSGFHRLQFWAPSAKPAPDERTRMQALATVDLDPDATYGYHFMPDGKTFRTVYREMKSVLVNGTFTSGYGVVEVREVDATTGKTAKALGRLEGEFLDWVLAPDGKRLLVLGPDPKGVTVTAHDADTGKKLWSATVERFDLSRGGLATGGPGGYAGSPGAVVSADGRRVVVNPGVGKPVVLDAADGAALPPLAGLDIVSTRPTAGAFSADGRLLVLTGQRYAAVGTQGGPGGKQVTVYNVVGQFLTVWDTATGRAVKSWDTTATAGFLPAGHTLAVFEGNRAGGTRLGFWDFAAEKK